MRWQVGKGGRVVRWGGGKGGRVARWRAGKRGGVVRWQSGRFLVSFKGGEHRLSPKFKLFVSDVTLQNEGADVFKTKTEKKTLPLKCLTFLRMH